MSLISIIVPVFNVEKYLSECIDSILSQTFTDIELILVDDGSTDNCPQICDEYAKKDKRIVVIHKENGGLSSARNAGLDCFFENSTSKYIGFIDSDDMAHPQMYEFLLRAIEETGSQIALCDGTTELTEDFYKKQEYRITPEESEYSGIFTHWHKIGVCDHLYAREIWENLRFTVGKICEDRVVFIPSHFSRKIVKVESKFYYHRIVTNSISHQKFTKSRLDLLWAVEERIKQLKQIDLKGKEKLLEKEVRFYCKHLEWYYQLVIRELKLFDEAKKLKKKLKNTFKEYKDIFDFPKDDFLDCYLLLYPVSTKIYIYKKAIAKKLKNFFSR